MANATKKAIVTVLGQDKVGIIAAVTNCMSDNNINILEIYQTVIDGYFSMMMVTDITNMSCEPEEIVAKLNELSEKTGLRILFQRSEIFEAMHRI